MKKENEHPMNHPLDNLFREKMSTHQLTPSAQAWQRVSSALVKKNNSPVVYRIAAAVLLLCVITALVMRYNVNNSVNQPVAKTQKAVPLTRTQPASANTNTAMGNRATGSHIRKVKHHTPAVLPEKKEETKLIPTDVPAVPETPVVEETPSPVVTAAIAIRVNTSQESTQPIVIEFRLDPVEAAPEQLKGKKSLQKVLDLARDAKESSPLANLRDVKNDLFALNFKKDKTNNAK